MYNVFEPCKSEFNNSYLAEVAMLFHAVAIIKKTVKYAYLKYTVQIQFNLLNLLCSHVFWDRNLVR